MIYVSSLVEKTPTSPDDILIVAGDISEDLGVIEGSFSFSVHLISFRNFLAVDEVVSDDILCSRKQRIAAI